ncbi:MAG: MBL fold metallo-hydrolase [Clostridia bacterium]|nr:MBL fold metallo-hydrolase [Clostridia bacterium]
MILKRIKIETSIENFTNCYVVADEKENEAMVIDPAGECNKIMEMLEILRNKVEIYLFNTLPCRSYSEL